MSQAWLLSLFSLFKSSFHFKPKLPSKDERLRKQILSVLSVHPAYGHRRIAIALGKEAGRRRVRRVMKLYGIKPYKRKRAWRKRKDLGNSPISQSNQGLVPLFSPPSSGPLTLPTSATGERFTTSAPSWTCIQGKS